MSRARALERGKVFLVGAGPGDPELLTLRAARLIAEAEDLVVDALVPSAVYRTSTARVLYVGKRAGRPCISQSRIDSILVELAQQGRHVVRLKGGDPCLFGRGAEEIRALQAAGIAYEVVPGVSSALAAAGSVGVSVTDRWQADRVVILTGHRRKDHQSPVPELPPYDANQTVVILMGLGNLEILVDRALACGYPPDLPAAAVSHATLPTQRSVAETLSKLPRAVAQACLEPPATIVVGGVTESLLASAESAVAARSWG